MRNIFYKKYDEDYLKRTLLDSSLTSFSSDLTITKEGNKALVDPMYFIEEGLTNSDHQGQISYHKNCH